ncbi:MAG: DUF309 domain-containing protein [Chloroflexi bacterium]|nr:DUF309 domain-containing protein [Chloroflexota bacterium]
MVSAIRVDTRLTESRCDGPAPPELAEAVAQFNDGDYFGAHETLEALWLREPGAIRDFYRGIIQISVGFHHLQRHNVRGARLCFERGIARVRRFEPVCLGMDVRQIVAEAEAARAALSEAGRQISGDDNVVPRPRIRLSPEHRISDRSAGTRRASSEVNDSTPRARQSMSRPSRRRR